MGREDIGELIASTLDELVEAPERIEPEQRILDRYAELFRQDEGAVDPSDAVALPTAQAAPPPTQAPAEPLVSRVRGFLGRMKR